MNSISSTTTNSTPVVPALTTTALAKPTSIATEVKIPQSQAQPVFLKPITIIKASNGANKTSNLKSHIKIGKNIFAIIQDSNTRNISLTSCTNLNISVPQNTSVNMSKQPVVNWIKMEDHDYAEEEEIDIIGTRGVSKVCFESFVVNFCWMLFLNTLRNTHCSCFFVNALKFENCMAMESVI